MNDIEDSQTVHNAPEGFNYLHSVMHLASKCDTLTKGYFDSEHGKNLKVLCDRFGTLLSLIERACTCYWGCRGGDHQAERLFGRCCSYGMSAYRLANSGNYDESLSLIRTISEITNLAFLFVASPEDFESWKTADDNKRKKLYSPVKVRCILQQKMVPVPVHEYRYAQLCTRGTHATPTFAPQMYNGIGISTLGCYFQEIGLILCLGELGTLFGLLGPSAAILCGIRGEKRKVLLAAAEAMDEPLLAAKIRAGEIGMTVKGGYGSEPEVASDPGCIPVSRDTTASQTHFAWAFLPPLAR